MPRKKIENTAPKKQKPKKPVVVKEEAQDSAKKRGIRTIALLRGMKDVLPKESLYWMALVQKAQDVARSFSFHYIVTPILEEAALFTRSLGKGTDIIDKEMYTFEDRDMTKVALRPEFTANICRAFIQHGMHTWPQPVKVWTVGPLFRHDRPQAGRYRQHHQIDFELYGDPKPIADAEIILTAYSIVSDLGLNVTVCVNSLGTSEDRMRYKLELVNYYRSKRGYLCDDCKKRITKNPLRLLDCKKEQCQPIKEDAPQILDWLAESSKAHFMHVLEYLDEVGVPYVLDSTLVRGLDYYNHTTFELFLADGEATETAQSALGGGGRYDGLIEMLGGPATPAVGFGIGVERVMQALREAHIPVPPLTSARIYVAQLGEQATRRALGLLNDLRKAGVAALHNFGKTGLKAQLELANKDRAAYCVIVGQKEVVDGTAIVRDMESGIQEIIGQKQLVTYLNKKLAALPPLEPVDPSHSAEVPKDVPPSFIPDEPVHSTLAEDEKEGEVVKDVEELEEKEVLDSGGKI
ncbi:MAG TPA: histidine--tRNA ligase [Candidatus Magasanikbacteria bacterium]|nr:histidine--tRNA ligase [Candidatus Magasanikbacteria bacterium]